MLDGLVGFGSTLARLAGANSRSSPAGALPTYAIANAAVDVAAVSMPFAPGYVRGQPESALAFATEALETNAINAFAQEELSRAGLQYVESAAIYEAVDASTATTLL